MGKKKWREDNDDDNNNNNNNNKPVRHKHQTYRFLENMMHAHIPTVKAWADSIWNMMSNRENLKFRSFNDVHVQGNAWIHPRASTHWE